MAPPKSSAPDDAYACNQKSLIRDAEAFRTNCFAVIVRWRGRCRRVLFPTLNILSSWQLKSTLAPQVQVSRCSLGGFLRQAI